MNNPVSHFSLEVDGVAGVCPAGEKWAKENISKKATPVLACEGPCIRGEIARLAANIVGKEDSYRCPSIAQEILGHISDG